MAHHDLKVWPESFAALWKKTKLHEVRRDDRSFEEGDTAKLSEYLPGQKLFTGRWISGSVGYVTRSGPIGSNVSLPTPLCVFSFFESARHGDED